MGITILSGPVGAGKTTVARELVALLPAPVSYIEGDTFWSFVEKAHSADRREVIHVIMCRHDGRCHSFRARRIRSAH